MHNIFNKKMDSFDFPNRDTTDFFAAILQLKSIADCEAFFRDLCTLHELKTLSERWRIAVLLWQGFPYRTIARKTRASSTTIARVSHWVQYGNGGLRKLCHLLAEEQADDDYRQLTQAYQTNASARGTHRTHSLDAPAQ